MRVCIALASAACVLLAAALGTIGPSGSRAVAQATTTPTTLSCNLYRCQGGPGDVCADVAWSVALTIDVAGERARGGDIRDWVQATIVPDQVTFGRQVAGAVAIDSETFVVSRTTLEMNWAWSRTPPAGTTTGTPLTATANYRCHVVQPQF
jgi:hypothetical protein